MKKAETVVQLTRKVKKSTPPPAAVKPAEKQKPKKSPTQQEHALRKFPPVMTEEEEAELEKQWREKGPEVAAQREAVTQMHLQTAADGMENPADEMETREPEGEPSTVEVIMDTSEMDTTCDRHTLPPAESTLE